MGTITYHNGFGAAGSATSIAPGTPISGGSGDFTTLSSTSATSLSTTAGQFTTIGTGAATTKLNVYGTHVSGIGIAQFTGDSTVGYMAIASASAGEAGFLLKPGGTLSGQIYADATGVRIKNRIFGISDQFTLNNSGRIGIGAIAQNATAQLHLPAGAAAASGAPLKLTAGTNLTVVENGAIEFDGTNYYASAGGVRRTITMV